MVVLEGGGMLTSSGNQYLQPDYLSPLPTTLDAKKSPLALLAQTCSQIGADSPNTKPLISTLDKPKKSSQPSNNNNNDNNNTIPRASPAGVGLPKQTRTSPLVELTSTATSGGNKQVAFKPYENNVTKKSSDEVRPSSKSAESDGKKTPVSNKSVPSSNTTPVPSSGVVDPGKTTPDRKSTASPATSTRGASPIIRSGLEILQGHPKDLPLGTYKPGYPLGLCCPPGMEHTVGANPAFRPPFAGGPYSHHHAAAAAAAAMLAAGYPPSGANPYVSYARVKTPSGGEALVPVCKDPYCTGCQYSMHNQLMSAAGPCPSGCTQCDHQKYAMAMSSLIQPPPPGPLSYTQLGSPYVCNWIAGDSYCGKRFRTSDELLQHLRTHTGNGAPTSEASATSSAALLNPLFSTAALHRAAAVAAAAGYPNPPLSPLSAARYHPYAKPPTGGMPSTLGASPYSAFNPTLSPYYPPYSLYGQRLGAAVHP